jgi:hypothetical protein
MAGIEMKDVVIIALVVVVILFIVYQYDSSMFGLLQPSYEGFADAPKPAAEKKEEKKPEKKEEKKPEKKEEKKPEQKKAGFQDMNDKEEKKEGFADLNAYEGPAQFGSADAPAGCYPRDQLTPSELLPKDMASVWAEQNPMGPGSLKGKNFLSAGALIGVNTVGQSLRNANLQVRSEPPCPQVAVSIFNQSTISPDISHRPLEIGA